MKKVYIIFGADGDLGKGVRKAFEKNNLSDLYLFDRKFKDKKDGSINFLSAGSLTEEENVSEAFGKLPVLKTAEYFLYSTIGGFAGGESIIETDYSTWKKMNALNLNISFLLAKYFMKLVSKGSGGSILFTSAMTSFSPTANQAAYGASKIGLNYLVETLALEGKKYNLTANAVAPFALDTKENRSWVADKKMLSKPEDIGKFALYLFENYKSFNGNVFKLPNTIK